MTETFLKTLSSLVGFVMTMIGVRVLGRHHQVDWRSQRFSHMLSGNKDLSYKTKTWSVKGEVRAYRQFKIVKIKDMSTSVPGTHAMSLAGIELYGVLSVPYLD